MKTNPINLNPGLPISDFILNLNKAKFLVNRIATDCFTNAHAEIYHEKGCPSCLQIGSWIPPRENDPGVFSEKVSLGLPSEEFAEKIDGLFHKYRGDKH